MKITWLENKQSANGKEYKIATIEGIGDASVWPDFPGYEDLKAGSTVEGKILTKGKYRNLVSEHRSVPAGMKPNFMKAMDKKEASIGRFQDDKEKSIKISSTARDATLLTVAQFQGSSIGSHTDEDFKATWLKWRNWLLNNWEVDFKDLGSPF